MDLGPDLYTYTYDHTNPQEESSSAASNRANEENSTSQAQSLQTSSFTTAIEDPNPPITHDPNEEYYHENPVFKGKPTTKICQMHEFCYSSQRTRPVVEMLTEVLEGRHPAASPPWWGLVCRGESKAAEQEALLGERGLEGEQSTCCWMHRVWGKMK
jgi:hypothetical protein